MKVILGQGDADRTGLTPPVDDRTLGRFLEEAQVTGQLDHPGIVPVHEVGLDPAGRVFFTEALGSIRLGEVLSRERQPGLEDVFQAVDAPIQAAAGESGARAALDLAAVGLAAGTGDSNAFGAFVDTLREEVDTRRTDAR